MTEGLTYAECEALMTITVVADMPAPWGGDERLQLVRDGAGGWGHHVLIPELEAERAADGADYDGMPDRDNCMWYCDEATARECLKHDHIESDCMACGLTYLSNQGTRTAAGIWICPVCARK